MRAREISADHCRNVNGLCLCNCCGKLHSNCPFEMSMVEDIIAEVKKRRELWSSKDPNFRNCKLKSRIWGGLATKLGIESSILKKHWNYLKGQFKKELYKLSPRLSEGGEQQVSSWQYFEPLSFLREEFEDPSSNITMTPLRGEVEVSGNLGMSYLEEGVNPFNVVPGSQIMDNSDTGSIPPAFQELEEHNSTHHNSTMPSTSSRVRLSVDPQAKNSMMSEYTKSRVVMTEVKLGKDEDFYYLMSILPMMKSLTQVQKSRFRMKIEQYLLEAISTNEHASYLNSFSPIDHSPVQETRKRKRSRI